MIPRAAATAAALLAAALLPACGRTPEPPPHTASFVRFVELRNPLEPLREQKHYIGNDQRNVLFAPRTSADFLKPVDSGGYVAIEAGIDFEMPTAEAAGVRLRAIYQSSALAFHDGNVPAYHFIPRGELAAGPVRVRVMEPDTRDRVVRCWVRDVLPAAWRWESGPVVIPPGAVLEAAVGLAQDWPIGAAERARFVVSLEAGRAKVLFDEAAGPAPEGELAEWRPIRIDLAAHAGQEARFVFESHAVPGAPDPPFGFPLWANPVLYSKGGARPGAGPNLLLISLDTLRADSLGCYGHPRPLSPNLDAFAGSAALFEQCIAPSSWTTPSHASLFTGLFPSVHGAGIWSHGYVLEDRFHSFVETARAQGYLTAAFTEGVALRGLMGFGQGFDTYDDGPAITQGSNDAVRETFGNAQAWLERFHHLPFVLFAHTYKIHEPYGAPEPWRSRFTDPAYDGPARSGWAHDAHEEADRAHIRDLYDAGVAYTDEVAGAFLRRVEELGLGENTVIVIFSDHGEEFWEHGAHGHTTQMFDETLRVPLLIRLPGGGPPVRVARQVALSDVFATVMQLFGSPADAPDSWSLLPLIAPLKYAGAYPRDRVASQLLQIDEAHSRAHNVLTEWTTRTLRNGAEKYHVSDKRALVEAALAEGREAAESWFDLETDPGETSDLAPARPERLPGFQTELREYLDAAARGVEASAPKPDMSLTHEDFSDMEAMGYLGGAPKKPSEP